MRKKALSALFLSGALILLLFLSSRHRFYGVIREGKANQKDLSWISEDEKFSPEFQGAFIWNDTNDNNTFMRFRKTVTLGAEDFKKDIIAYAAADSRYWLYINGKIVVREGGEKRGVTKDSTYYDTLNLTDYLHEGENLIAAQVWYFGPDEYNFSYASSGHAGFYMEIDTSASTITTDESWKVYHNMAFQSAPNEANIRLAEKDIVYLGYYADHWTDPGYDDSFWQNAVVTSLPGELPAGNMVPRKIPLFRDEGLREYEDLSCCKGKRITSEYEDVTVTLPGNIQFYPYLEVEADAAGSIIEIRTDQYEDVNGNSVKCSYVTKKGRQSFESPGWMNGGKVIYRIPKGIKILSLEYRETGYDTSAAGSFSCSDPFYKALWKKAENTLLVNMRDTYMDCPNRERAQWFADMAIEMTETNYALDENADALYRAGMDTVFGWADPDGALQTIVPMSAARNEMPIQMLMGFCSYWDHYCRTGDPGFLTQVYAPSKKYLEFWNVDENGSISINRDAPVWMWADSTDGVDEPVIETAWYYYALTELERIASEIGYTEDEIFFEERKSLIEKGFDRFWTAEGYRSDFVNKPDERAQAIAVLSGLADASKYPVIAGVFEKSFQAAPLLEYYVESACIRIGRADLAEMRMKRQYAPMIEGEHAGDIDTLWEYWTYGQGTSNHAWSGGPLVILSRDFAGIHFLPETADADFLIAPAETSLTEISASARSAKGIVSVTIKKNGDKSILTLSQPEGTVSHVYLPSFGIDEMIRNTETEIIL